MTDIMSVGEQDIFVTFALSRLVSWLLGNKAGFVLLGNKCGLMLLRNKAGCTIETVLLENKPALTMETMLLGTEAALTIETVLLGTEAASTIETMLLENKPASTMETMLLGTKAASEIETVLLGTEAASMLHSDDCALSQLIFRRSIFGPTGFDTLFGRRKISEAPERILHRDLNPMPKRGFVLLVSAVGSVDTHVEPVKIIRRKHVTCVV